MTEIILAPFIAVAALLAAFGIVYAAGWLGLLILSVFEDNIIPFFRKKFARQ